MGEFLFPILEVAIDEGSIDEARGDAGDLVRGPIQAELITEGFGHGSDREFGGGIESAGRGDAVSGEGGDINDAPSGRGEALQCLLIAEGETEHVDFPHLSPVGGISVGESGQIGDSSAVHEGVELGAGRVKDLESVGDALGLTEVTGDGRDAVGDFTDPAAHAEDGGALGEEGGGDCSADAAGSPGDEDGFAGECSHGQRISSGTLRRNDEESATSRIGVKMCGKTATPGLAEGPQAATTLAMRTLTGLQPSGKAHVGNYFGAMQPAVQLQEEGDAYYFIADYHAMTSTHDPAELKANVREMAIDFLACGLNPEKALFFRQSDVPEVNELAWILSTVCPMGLLERCHSYKDKVAKGISASHALFAYPVLMAADILLYDSNKVPVGDDQKQHLEVTRDLVGKVNERFGEGTLVLPEAIIREGVAKVPGLDGQKMSKSYNNTLPIFGSEKPLRKTVMKILTDSTPVEEPKSTEGSVILDLYKLMASEGDYAAMVADHQAGGFGYGDFKKRLWEAYWEYFAPFREKREAIEGDLGYVDRVLAAGAEKARETAQGVLERVRKAAGLR